MHSTTMEMDNCMLPLTSNFKSRMTIFKPTIQILVAYLCDRERFHFIILFKIKYSNFENKDVTKKSNFKLLKMILIQLY